MIEFTSQTTNNLITNKYNKKITERPFWVPNRFYGEMEVLGTPNLIHSNMENHWKNDWNITGWKIHTGYVQISTLW